MPFKHLQWHSSHTLSVSPQTGLLTHRAHTLLLSIQSLSNFGPINSVCICQSGGSMRRADRCRGSRGLTKTDSLCTCAFNQCACLGQPVNQIVMSFNQTSDRSISYFPAETNGEGVLSPPALTELRMVSCFSSRLSCWLFSRVFVRPAALESSYSYDVWQGCYPRSDAVWKIRGGQWVWEMRLISTELLLSCICVFL